MKYILLVTILIASVFNVLGQESTDDNALSVTLPQAIDLAKKQSIQSFREKNMYLANYWDYRAYRASKLPQLRLQATPLSYSNSIKPYTDAEGTSYRSSRDLTSSGRLSLSQNVTPLGGTISLNSNIVRYEEFDNINSTESNVNFINSLASIKYEQSVNGYNEFKWLSRISPIEFEKAKKDYIQGVEDICISTVNYFFSTVSAEINLKIAETNYFNADTLHRIGKGRFEIGTVTQDELLDLELSVLNSKNALSRATLNLTQARIRLNSFLGLEDNVTINCIIPKEIPAFKVAADKAIDLALENNPELLEYELNLLNAKQNVAKIRSSSGLNAAISANLGYNKQSADFAEVYNPRFNEDQGVSLSLGIPIVDWGERRGKVQMAKSNQQVTEATVRQGRIDFKQQMFMSVAEFNMQEEQVVIAAKADTIAQLGYDVTKQRFLIDKVDVIKLNSARNSLDSAKRSYIDALKQFWNYYFNIRKLTLFDFEANQPLTEEFDTLLQTM